jgi:hypothetical protein
MSESHQLPTHSSDEKGRKLEMFKNAVTDLDTSSMEERKRQLREKLT